MIFNRFSHAHLYALLEVNCTSETELQSDNLNLEAVENCGTQAWYFLIPTTKNNSSSVLAP